MLNSVPVLDTEYTDFTAARGETYYYVVSAVNSSNVQSTFSNEVSATVP
jgi:fibronectin type 3 domain-containing protein